MQGGEEPLRAEVTCRGLVDGIAIVIHMTSREGRRFVEPSRTWYTHYPTPGPLHGTATDSTT